MTQSEADAPALVRRALMTQDEAYLEAEQALLDHGHQGAVTEALAGSDDPAAPLLAEVVARPPARGPDGAGAAEIDRHLARLERYFEKKAPGVPPAHAVVDGLSARFGPGAAELLALRLHKRSAPPDWRTSVALAFLQRHPSPAAVAALLRFTADSAVPWQRDLAVSAIRAAADPALSRKLAVERARLTTARRAVPAQLAALDQRRANGSAEVPEHEAGTTTRLLRAGTTGEDVMMAQVVLNYHRISPSDEVLVADGVYGPRTQARVRSFQRQNLLLDDGIVGDKTSRALMTICRFSARYVADRRSPETPVAEDPSSATSVERAYELKNGAKVTLNPWKAPPAVHRYVLEFEGAWVLKNPGAHSVWSLGVGLEIGRVAGSPSPDAPYTYSGAGKVIGKYEKHFTAGPIKLDSSIQAKFGAEHAVGSPHVAAAAQLSLVSGISFEVVHNRFYLFTQGELGAVLEWHPGTVQASAQWEGSAGLRLAF